MCKKNSQSKEISLLNININEPRYDQETYTGRALHFLKITSPLNLLTSKSTLENARYIVQKHRSREELPANLTEDQLWKAKVLYDSAFHPDTGELMPLIGRMSAQVPMNMLITGGMLAFYKSTPAVIFWQWINQSFNAIVNHTNRSGNAQLSNKQLVTSYVCATTGALVTALGLNRLVKNLPPIAGRLVPFAAVAAANCVNIPMMRAHELKTGTPVYDKNNNKLGISKVAAQNGISQVILSRIAMAAPGMVLVPIVVNRLERQGTLCRYPWMTVPLQIALVGLCLTFATPLCCALFKQKAEIRFNNIEPEVQEKIRKKTRGHPPHILYYNKGL